MMVGLTSANPATGAREARQLVNLFSNENVAVANSQRFRPSQVRRLDAFGARQATQAAAFLSRIRNRSAVRIGPGEGELRAGSDLAALARDSRNAVDVIRKALPKIPRRLVYCWGKRWI
jgi:hypothetical protein